MTKSVYIPAGTEILLDGSAEAKNDWDANIYSLTAKFRKSGTSDYDNHYFAQTTLTSSDYTSVEGSRTIVTDVAYDQVELLAYATVISGRPETPSGVFSVQNADIKIMTRDVLRNGA